MSSARYSLARYKHDLAEVITALLDLPGTRQPTLELVAGDPPVATAVRCARPFVSRTCVALPGLSCAHSGRPPKQTALSAIASLAAPVGQ